MAVKGGERKQRECTVKNRKPLAGTNGFLGMVGSCIFIKNYKGGPDGYSPSGMSMKKLCDFKCELETKARHPFG